MSATRSKRKPVFDPNALDEDIDDLWPTRRPAQPTAPPTVSAEPPAPAAAAGAPPTSAAPPPVDQDTAPASTTPPATDQKAAPEPAARAQHPTTRAGSGASNDRRRHLSTVARAPQQVPKRARPPEALLSTEVYDELYRVQLAEKKTQRGMARTMGAIVLDAIEAHAARLATTWSSEEFAVGEGQLFERPSSNAVPRRRRHVTAPRTVVLSGVTAANAGRLDDLVAAWGAGTRSALVEQALRYEFDMLHRPS